MGDTTAISWADATFNPVIGCTAVDRECDHCYAQALSERYGWAKWGAKQPRKRTAPSNWRKPYKWEREAIESGTRPRVFCASLADVFDAEWEPGIREDLWQVLRDTPHLDWLLLTKRPNLIRRMLPADWGDGWPNVWLGTTVGHQGSVWRIDHLLKVPATVRFLSCEPLLGPLDLRERLGLYRHSGPPCCLAQEGYHSMQGLHERMAANGAGIHWIIGGGESGKDHRPMDWAWARDLQRQCAAAGVAFWWKQTSGPRPGTGTLLDGVEYHELPTPRLPVLA